MTRPCQLSLPCRFFFIFDPMISIPYRTKIQNCSQIYRHKLTIQLCSGFPPWKLGREAWVEVYYQIVLMDMAEILEFHSIWYRDHLVKYRGVYVSQILFYFYFFIWKALIVTWVISKLSSKCLLAFFCLTTMHCMFYKHMQ